MKISEAIEEFDALVANTLDAAVKVRWLSDLDLQVNREILIPHGIGRRHFEGYGQEPDMEQELLIPAGFTEIYRHYMEAQLCGILHEDGGYNRAANQFNTKYVAFGDYINRKHMPRRTFLRMI